MFLVYFLSGQTDSNRRHPAWETKTACTTLDNTGHKKAINPGKIAFLACASCAYGLSVRARWGWRLALGILAVNLAGDTLTALILGDLRTLIGLPIGGALIAYLLSRRIRDLFSAMAHGSQ